MSVHQNSVENSVTNKFGCFYNLFKGLESYMMTSSSKRWLKSSRFYELSRKDTLDAIKINPEVRRAYKIAQKQDFLVLKVDDGIHLQELNLRAFCTSLCAIGITKFSLFKESSSDDIHIYVYFEKPIQVEPFIQKLNAWLLYQEQYSSIKASFIEGPIAIPCQSGFAWLNDKGTIVVERDQITDLSAISLFLSDYENKKIDANEVMSILESKDNFEELFEAKSEEEPPPEEEVEAEESEDDTVIDLDKARENKLAEKELQEITNDATEVSSDPNAKLPPGAKQLSLFDELNQGRAPP